MDQIGAQYTNALDLTWLLEVTESRQPLSDASPIWIRHGSVAEGPSVKRPERHPYCEIGIVFEGEGITYVEKEETSRRLPGDLLLLGPGIPHWGRVAKYPLRFLTVYFLPSILIDFGPTGDGVRILRRFTAKQSLSSRIIHPPRRMLPHWTSLLQQIKNEFEKQSFGREIKLRTLLMDLLVSILRWEESKGVSIYSSDRDLDWQPIMKTLVYLRDHYTEPVYAKDVARAAGMSESRLKIVFKEAIGMSWVKYLQGYRIHRAAALLGESGHNVTDAALQVGFESLSHFNAIFRSFMKVAPTEYLKHLEKK